MHGFMAAIPVVMGAEKSRTAFYIAGGVLAAWAVFVALALGLRRDTFAASAAGARLVMGISLALVLATGATSLLTESTPKKGPAAAASAAAAAAPAAGSPAGGEAAHSP